jgi:Arc/MetJ-type ribon-helix-helix transcriptional regulator
MKENIKERFSITLDDDLINWIESLIKDKTFSNRVHAVEFCVSEIKKMGIGNIMAMRWEKTEPIWVSEAETKTIKRISKQFNIDENEALNLLIYSGFEKLSENPQGHAQKRPPQNSPAETFTDQIFMELYGC